MKQQRENTIVDYLKSIEEFEKNYIGIEEQDTEDIDTNMGMPYNISDIRIEQKMLNVYQIENWIMQSMLNLQPEYQRNLVWDDQRKTALIESLLLRIPLPSFYLNEDENGYKNVIDGMQRLSTIHEFVQNAFPLKKMQYFPNCENMIFRELPMMYQSYIMETVLTVNILDARCPQMIKFDIFKRVNTGGLQLNFQEIRNIMAKPMVRNLLKEMASCEEFRTATGRGINDIRMGAQELCLRLITILYHYDWDHHNRLVNYVGLMKTMDNMIVELNMCIERDYRRILSDFKRAMRQAHMILGSDIFTTPGQKRVNASLFTSWAAVLMYYKFPNDWIEKNTDRIYNDYKTELEEKNDFYHAVTSSTGSRKNILTALAAIQRILEVWQ